MCKKIAESSVRKSRDLILLDADYLRKPNFGIIPRIR